LKGGVVNAREVAGARGLVLFWAEGERVDVDARVGVAGVVVEGLDEVEVCALAFREAVLAIELEFGRDNGILAPAVEAERGLGEDEGARIRNRRTAAVFTTNGTSFENVSTGRCGAPHLSGRNTRGIHGAGGLEETRGIDEGVAGGGANSVFAAERVDGVGEGIDRIGVVEWLGTEGLEKERTALERGAVVDILVGLDNPDKLFAGVVEVELDLVRRRSD